MWYAKTKRLNERYRCNSEKKIGRHMTKDSKGNRLVNRKNS